MPAVVRLVTVHPALVHITLGALAVSVLAWLAAGWTRSERWGVAADLTLGFTALVTIATAGFGAASFLVLDWPGGMGTWPWLHLGFGAATSFLLVVIGAIRLRARRHRREGGVASFTAVIVAALLAGFTGWVGGEVLVFRTGMAVHGAGNGALGPPITSSRSPPTSLADAMGRLRARWGEAQTSLAESVVDHPTDRRYAVVADAAEDIAVTAQWIERRRVPLPAPSGEAIAGRGGSRQPVARDEAKLAQDAGQLTGPAEALAEAARAHNLPGAAAVAGALSETCASCHLEHRWKPHAR